MNERSQQAQLTTDAKNDESAFPIVHSNAVDSWTQHSGLTKRELFAAMAMQTLAPQFVNGGDFMEKHVAVGAVTLADALLKELAK